MKLLIVEDEKRMAQALTEILRLEKYEVDAASTGCREWIISKPISMI